VGVTPVPWRRAGPILSASPREKQSDIVPATECEKVTLYRPLVPLIIPFI
jgi:hypothetical protein